MKKYTYKNLPELNGVKAEGDIRTEMPSDLKTFLKGAMWDNLFTFPVANIIYLILIVGAIVLAVVFGDIGKPLKLIAVIVLLKIGLGNNLAKLYRSFGKSGVFPVVTPEGINHMYISYPKGKKFLRLSTMKWEAVKAVRVYKDFITVEVKDPKAFKDDIGLAYLWTDDVQKLRDHMLYFWKNALAPSDPDDIRLILYSEKDEDEVVECIKEDYGDFQDVLHEVVSTDIHLDVALIPPQEDRDYHTLCTIGAGAYRMEIERDIRTDYHLSEHSEYILYLPSDWKLDEESLKDEANYWPIRLLKNTARIPVWNETWFTMGHTVGSEDGEAYSEEYPYNSAILTYPAPYVATREDKCNLSSGKTILFHHVFPITQEELEYKNENGTAALLERIFPKGCDEMDIIISRLKREGIS